MEEIVFSVGDHGVEGTENLRLLLQKFEQQYGIHVRLDIIPYASLRWSSLVEAALYHTGLDVSEVGNTWVGDLVRMEALRPFQPEEVDRITGTSHYFDVVWQSSIRMNQGLKTVYSIPWSSDARAIFYRRDLLENAGIDEATAFVSFAQLEKTLSILAEKSNLMPLALPTRRSNMTLHCIASWVWGAGGDFLTPDGTGLAFNGPQALEGCKAYFRLKRFLGVDARNLEDYESDDAFDNGKAAVLLSGFWIPTYHMIAEVRKNLGGVPMPGTGFVGGADLVIWRHSRHELSALKLIQFFHTEEVSNLIYPWFGLPISENGWSNPPFDTDIYQVFRTAIKNGRGFPTAQLWGLVEKRLTDTLADIWVELLRESDAFSDAIVENHLNELARRMELTLDL